MLDPITELRERLMNTSYRKLADELGLPASYLHDVNVGKRPPSDRLIDALGLERKETYRRKPK